MLIVSTFLPIPSSNQTCTSCSEEKVHSTQGVENRVGFGLVREVKEGFLEEGTFGLRAAGKE